MYCGYEFEDSHALFSLLTTRDLTLSLLNPWCALFNCFWRRAADKDGKCYIIAAQSLEVVEMTHKRKGRKDAQLSFYRFTSDGCSVLDSFTGVPVTWVKSFQRGGSVLRP